MICISFYLWSALENEYYFAGFQACATVCVRPSLFWGVAELWLVVSPETSVTIYQPMLHSIQQEPRPRLVFSLPVIRL